MTRYVQWAALSGWILLVALGCAEDDNNASNTTGEVTGEQNMDGESETIPNTEDANAEQAEDGESETTADTEDVTAEQAEDGESEATADTEDANAEQAEDSKSETTADTEEAISEEDTISDGTQAADDTGQESTEEVEPFSLAPGVNELTWEEELSIGTTTRQLVIHTPDSYPNHGPIPILFAFHGSAAGAPEGVEPEKQWIGKLGPMVNQEKFIGVYLRGIAGGWQLGPEEGDITTEEVIATIQYLKARMEASPGVDQETAYCFGSSNGAALCQYTAANIGLFKGIGAEVSTLDEGGAPKADLPKVSVVQMMNFKDMIIPYEGGEAKGHIFMQAEEGAAAWAAHNGCDPTPALEEVDEPFKQTFTYSGCEDGTIVVHVGAMPIPWDDSCESGGPPDPDLCGGNHTVADEHFELPGGPWRYAFDLLSGAP